jgi:nucleoside-diphosphate-sugar epimerase
VRLSSVYGDIADHADRIAPAFAHTAAFGGTIRMEGRHHVFDFTHVDDVAQGLAALVRQTEEEGRLPPIHLVSGRGTSIAELADMAARSARAPLALTDATPRSFGVSRFVGNPRRALDLLNWQARIPIETGMADLVSAYAAMPQQLASR